MGEEDKTIRFGLRIPESLYLELKEKARARGHSINTEIVLALMIEFGTEEEMARRVHEDQRVNARMRNLEDQYHTIAVRLDEMLMDIQRLKENRE
jgi:Arc-like DNA binding domain